MACRKYSHEYDKLARRAFGKQAFHEKLTNSFEFTPLKI